MGGEWRIRSLGDVIDVKHGFAFKGKYIHEDPRGDILLTPGNFAIGGGFRGTKVKYYDGPVPDDFVLREGDLVISMTDLSKQSDTLGFPALVPRSDGIRRYLHNQRLGKVVLKEPSSIDTRFLHYLLRSHSYRHEVLASATGTTVKHTSPDRIKRFEFPCPPLPEQRSIAHILGTLDEKIELNRRMNETLEAMARALFRSWFVEIEVKRVKVQEFIDDKFIEIGDGYRAKNTELREPGLPFVRAKNLADGFDTDGADVLQEESVAKAGPKISRRGDVAFTSKGTIGRFARVSEFNDRFVYSPQVCYWRSLNDERVHPAVLYYWMQSPDLRSQIEAVAGQTDMAPYVSLRDQKAMEIPVFPESQKSVGRHLDSLLTRQALANAESRTLCTLRNALLPHLVSGRLRLHLDGSPGLTS